MSSNLSVKITADIVDLQSKFSVAKAEVSALTAEMNKLARASAQGTIDPTGAARLQQVTSDFVAAKTQAAALGSQLSAASGGMLGFSRAAAESHGSISTATREFRALFDELSSGRTRQTPGTLAIIAQRVLGLGPAALGAVAGVGALVGGLGYLAYRAIEASRAISQIDLSTSFARNLDITQSAIKRYVESLSQASGVSSSEAQKIVGAFASIPGMTNAALATLSQSISAFAQETGQDADKAAEGLAKLFGEDVSAAEFAKKFGALTQLSQAQINQAQTADRSGDSAQIMAQKLTILNQAVTAATPQLKSMTASFLDTAAAGAAVAEGIDVETARTSIINEQAAAIDRATAARKQFLAIASQQTANPEQILKTGVSAAEKENPISQQITEAQAKIAEMNAALEVARQRGDQIDIDKLNAGLEKAKENLSQLQFGPVLERMRDQMSQVAATWDGTQSGMLAKQQQVAQSMLSQVRANSKEYLAIQAEANRLEVQMKHAAGTEAIADARERISEIGSAERVGVVQRLEAERDIWQQVLAGDQLTASQRVEVSRALNQQLGAIVRERAREAQTIERQNAAADIQISRLKVEAAKEAADQITVADQASAARRLAALRQLTAQEFALNEAALEAELQGLIGQPAEYNRVYNQIRELKAKLVVDLEKLDKDYEQEVRRVTKQESQAWRGAVNEIESAESSFISDVLNRRKSMSQSLLSIGAELVTREIQNDVKAMTTRLLLQNTEQNEQRAMEQSGFLYHLIFQNQATAATVTSQQAQTAAVVTGNAARTAATASGAAASKAAGAAAGGSTVMADAAKAFSGTYAAVAQIPYVGWILAPAAAAAAFAAVAAYEGLASLDTGTNLVPRDMTARIHKGEAVVPAGLNPFNPNGGGAGGLGGGPVIHLHNYMSAIDGASAHAFMESGEFEDGLTGMLNRYFNRGNR